MKWKFKSNRRAALVLSLTVMLGGAVMPSIASNVSIIPSQVNFIMAPTAVEDIPLELTPELMPTDQKTSKMPTDQMPTDQIPTDQKTSKMPTDQMPTDQIPTDQRTNKMPTDQKGGISNLSRGEHPDLVHTAGGGANGLDDPHYSKGGSDKGDGSMSWGMSSWGMSKGSEGALVPAVKPGEAGAGLVPAVQFPNAGAATNALVPANVGATPTINFGNFGALNLGANGAGAKGSTSGAGGGGGAGVPNNAASLNFSKGQAPVLNINSNLGGKFFGK